MTRDVSRDNADPSDAEVITFRGRQTSVTNDATGVHFETEHRFGRRVHAPVPVVSDDADPSDVPANAVARTVAEQLVDNNPLIGWGVVCEEHTNDGVCGDVFPSVSSLESHRQVHADD